MMVNDQSENPFTTEGKNYGGNEQLQRKVSSLYDEFGQRKDYTVW